MDDVKQIQDRIVADSSGFFDEPDIRQDLRVTIRIAGDFYDFLMKSGEKPTVREIAYVMDTIRSGVDQFFALAHICRVIDTGANTWTFDPQARWDFSGLREDFLRGFERLAGPDANAAQRLASLLALTHLELVFLAQHFPLAILEDLADSSESLGGAGKAGSDWT
jgi:hypothetical protein